MKDYILGGVANANMYIGEDLYAKAVTTLQDSGLSIAISPEEVRGGKGASLLGRYFHSTGLTLTMTNATFNLEYIGMVVGAEVEDGGELMFEEQLSTAESATSVILSKTPVSLGGCNQTIPVWYKEVGAEDWTKVVIDEGTTTISGLTAGKTYCFKYFYNELNAKHIIVKSDFAPKTVHVVLDADLYATGDSACDGQTKVGTLVIDVPAFQFDGSQDLTMSMTGTATLDLKGTALAVSGGDASCTGGKYYAKITQFVADEDWASGLKMIAADEGAELHEGDKLSLYAIFDGRAPLLITTGHLGTQYDVYIDGVKTNTLILPTPPESETEEVVLKTSAGATVASTKVYVQPGE